jgi:hypothetical protein
MKKDDWNIDEDEITKLGQALRSVESAKLKKTPGGLQEFWFQGKERYFDVFVTEDKKQIKWIQVTFRGHYLEWKNSSLTWGKAEDLKTSSQKAPASKALKPQTAISTDFVEVVIAILEENTRYEVLDRAALILEEAFEDLN